VPSSFILAMALGVAALALAGSVSWCCYLIADRLLPEAPGRVRACATVVVALWSLVAVFWLLGLSGMFRLPVALLVWLGAASVLHLRATRRASPLGRLRGDLEELVRFLRSTGWSERLLGGAVAAVAGVRFLRALASPPLGWDDLTYHLVKAARWVQAGRFEELLAPDAWRAYGHFPVAGEILWSWAMLPVRSDVLLAVAALGVWSVAVLAVYAGGRELGAERRPALFAALAVGAMPAALAYVSSAYVDNVVLAASALGGLFVVRTVRGGRPREALFAVAALVVAGGAKHTALPLLALGGAIALTAALRSAAPRAARWALLSAAVAISLVAVPTYLRSWIELGAPLYPFHLQVGGLVLSPGDPMVREATRQVLGESATYSLFDSLALLLVLPEPLGSFLNLGLGAVLILALALVAVPRFRGRLLGAALYLLAAAAVPLAAFFSSVMEVARTTYMVTTAGRYITPAFGTAGMVASRSRAPTVVWGLAIGCGAIWSLPRAWSVPGLEATALVAAVLVALVVVTVLALRLGGDRPVVVSALLVLVVAAAIAGVGAIRDRARYPIYQAAASWPDPAFQLHALQPSYVDAWPVWRALDGPRGLTLAVTAGFEGLGHNWYVYPLLGSRLQNRLLYVPVAAGGELIDYRHREDLVQRVTYECWLARLVARRVDAVVSLNPRTTVEDHWLGTHQDVFSELAADPERRHVAYRLDRDAAVAVLPDSVEEVSRVCREVLAVPRGAPAQGAPGPELAPTKR